jgi:hypothetical protein
MNVALPSTLDITPSKPMPALPLRSPAAVGAPLRHTSLQQLEAEFIDIIREAVVEGDNPVCSIPLHPFS